MEDGIELSSSSCGQHASIIAGRSGPQKTYLSPSQLADVLFPLFPLPVVAVGDVRSCVVSSPMGSFGGNAGAELPDSRRLCSKFGMVAMRGERAHGFLLDARSCSKVGSMKLTGVAVSRQLYAWNANTTNAAYRRRDSSYGRDGGRCAIHRTRSWGDAMVDDQK